jgi:hypothetical protein
MRDYAVLVIEIRNRPATIIQKIRERTPSLTAAPVTGAAKIWDARGRSRMRKPQGSPMARTLKPRIAKEARHPTARISTSAMGGKDYGAQCAAAQQDGKRRAAALPEPGGEDARIGELRCSVSHDAEKQEDRVEVP